MLLRCEIIGCFRCPLFSFLTVSFLLRSPVPLPLLLLQFDDALDDVDMLA